MPSLDSELVKLPKILIIPAPHISHLLPSFFLANLIKDRFEIVYYVEDSLQMQLVNLNGFNSIHFKDIGELSTVKKEQSNLIRLTFKRIFTRREIREKELVFKKIIQNINPDVILLDILRGIDFMIVKSLFPKKICYFNPMLSLHKQVGIPGIRDRDWVMQPIAISPLKRIINNILYLKSERTEAGLSLMQFFYNLPKSNSYFRETQYLCFQGVSEIILGLKELEFTDLRKLDSQLYIGLSINESRISFNNIEFDLFLEKFNKRDKKVIYCSFGTYYKGSLLIIYKFIDKLLRILESESDFVLIVSVNIKVKEALKASYKLLKNVHFFSNINQLKALEIANLFITHGGHGSIKEAIYKKVPVLVYPLDINHDQSGNGLKVEYHRIGLKGDIFADSTNKIRRKIKNILSNKEFKLNIEKLNLINSENYTEEKVKEDVLRALS